MANKQFKLADLDNDNFHGCYNYDNPYDTCLGCNLCNLPPDTIVQQCPTCNVFYMLDSDCPGCNNEEEELICTVNIVN